MNTKCSVPECTPPRDSNTEQYHRFPRDRRRPRWLAFCCILEDDGKDKYICSRHFPEDAYQLSYRMLNRDRKEWRLEKCAVPTLNPPKGFISDPDEVPIGSEDIIEEIIDEEPEDILIEDIPEEEPLVTPETSHTEAPVPEDESQSFLQCRICLLDIENVQENAIGINDAEEGETSFKANLKLVFQIELMNTPESPSIVCLQCAESLELAKQFRDISIYSNYYFLHEKGEEMEKDREKEYEETINQSVDASPILSTEEIEEDFPLIEAMENPSKDPLNDSCTQQIEEEKSAKNKGPMKGFGRSEVCPVCGLTYKKLRDHMSKHLPPSLYAHKCTECRKPFRTKHELLKHVQRIHDVKERAVCETCGKAFTSLATLQLHREWHRNKGKPKKNANGEEIPKRRSYKYITDALEKGLRTKCQLCGYTTAMMIKSHMKNVHGSEYVPSDFDKVMIPCETCGKEYQRFRMYIHIHSAHKDLECKICGERFSRNNAFQVHMDKHLDRKYPCHYCSYVNNSAQGRVLHIKAHHPNEYENIRRK